MKFMEGKVFIGTLVGAFVIVTTQSCAPRPPYRTPMPPPIPRTLPPPPPSPSSQESSRQPLPKESKINEQDLKTKGPVPSLSRKEPPKEANIGETQTPPENVAPPLPDDSSLLAKITPGTPPQRVASLRLTEDGKKLLDAGDPGKALDRLEKAIVIDSTNPYGYFFLAKAHYRLGRYQQSLNFLDIAESRLSQEPFWLAEVYALKGEDFRALGMTQKAEASYAQALRLNSGNRTAADALSRLQVESSSSPR
jgi:tetratricopeptide repeat protein